MAYANRDRNGYNYSDTSLVATVRKVACIAFRTAHLSESIYIHDNHHPYDSTATQSPA